MAKKGYQSDLLLGNIVLRPKQQEYHKIMTNYNTKVVFLSGPAGSSKTFLSVYAALDLYNRDHKLDIMYLRTVIESASRSVGFLKGDLNTKMTPYLLPLHDKIGEILSEQERQSLVDRKVLSGAPINFIRGSDWKNKVVIADEMQNANLKELLTIVTRINKGTKLFVCGDTMQSDIRDTGFGKLCRAFDNDEAREHGIHHLAFDKSDIMRDPVVSYLIDVIEPLL